MHATPPVIGPATPEQFGEILSFWRVAAAVASTTDDLSGLEVLVAHDPGALLVATDAGGRIVGTLIAAWDGWRGNFYRLVVHPDHRRLGLGRALVGAGETRLIQLGARRISLFAVGSHPAAVAFWDALGYRRDDDDVRFARNVVGTQKR
jgi:ribosomal protein S18 acetylase RimI-like enzyme